MSRPHDPSLEELIDSGTVRIRQGAILQKAPPPITGTDLIDRLRGMLLGLAIGDALGATSEGMNPSRRRAEHGEIRDYLPNWYADERPVGLPTDDTQLAFWALERMLEDDGLVPERVLGTFAERQIFGIGSTVRAALIAYGMGRPWTETGQASAGNGALMRIAPVLLPHVRKPSPALWEDAVLLGMITHNDYASNAACVSFVALLWDLLNRAEAPEPEWWLETFVARMAPLEGDTRYRNRTPEIVYEGPMAPFIHDRVSRALEVERPVQEACDWWYSGAYLLETLPSVLYILARHGDDPEEALVRAVNDTRDNDTVAAIVGAAVGALHGAESLPKRWRDGLLGRTGAEDDGRVCELIDRALERWT